MTTASKKYWPIDLKVFATFAIAWSLFLLAIAFFVDGDFMLADPLQAIVSAALFNFDNARMVLILEAGIFGVIGVGILAEQRWSLVFALIYMAQIVISHLAFAITYLPERFELTQVRETAMHGPVLVLITLYLWIRATDLIFDAPPAPARDAAPDAPTRPLRARHPTGEIGFVAGGQE